MALSEILTVFGINSLQVLFTLLVIRFFGSQIVSFFFQTQRDNAQSQLRREEQEFQITLDRKLIEHQASLDKKLNDIGMQATMKLTEYQNQLTQLNIQFQIKLSALLTKRLEMTDELYTLLVDSQKCIGLHVRELKISDDDSTREDASKAFNKFREFFYKKKIYFRLELCEKIEQLIKLYGESFVSYERANRHEQNAHRSQAQAKSADKFFNDAFQKLNHQIPEILIQIEEEFRRIMGVLEVD